VPDRGGRSSRKLRQAGQATLETAVLFPIALVILVLCVQLVVLGVSLAYSGVAADEAARAVSIGENPRIAVDRALPPGFRAKSTVSADGSSVRVTVSSGILIGDGVSKDVPVPINHVVVKEPR
jgi:pilus assembly protein CpaE